MTQGIGEEMRMGDGKLRAAIFFVVALAAGLVTSATVWAQPRGAQPPPAQAESLRFIHNQGENADELKYVARSSRFTLFLTTEEADVVLHSANRRSQTVPRGKMIVVPVVENLVRMRFQDADPPSEIDGFPSAKNASDLPDAREDGSAEAFDAVSYRGIYPGVDVIFRGDEGQIGFEVDLAPGADTSSMVLRLDGSTGVTLDSRGNARVHMGGKTLLLARPVVYAVRGGARRRVSAAYHIEPDGTLRFLISYSGIHPPLVSD